MKLNILKIFYDCFIIPTSEYFQDIKFIIKNEF